MVSFAVKHVESPGGHILAARVMGAVGGTVWPVRKHYDLEVAYLIDETNGSTPTSVTALFPSGKYTALDYTPTWAHHRFLGWFTTAATPTQAANISGTAVAPSDAIVCDIAAVYARWQLPATVVFDATTGGGSMPSGWTAPDYYEGIAYGTLPTPTHASLNFGGWYDALGNRVTAESIVPAGGVTLTARFVAQSFSVDLNSGAWELDSSANPDSSSYAGVYRSTNVGGDDTFAKMFINVVGYTSFRILLASSSEEGYDYAIAMDADVDPTDMPYDAYGETSPGVKASTSGDSYADPSVVADYIAVNYTLDGGTHRICVLYRKDSSYAEGDDRGYLLIPLVQN